MKKLKTGDSGYYWCAVEIKDKWTEDESSYLYLSVTDGTPGLWVDQQEVTGVEGGHVSVQCHYNELYDRKSWCRAGGSCVEVSSGKSGRSEIKDVSSKKVFNVTMREDTGWYWCAAGELQIPVHITVTQKTTTTTVTTLRTDSPKVEGETSITDDPTHHIFTVTMKTEHSGYYWCAVEIKDYWILDEGSYLYLSVTDGTPGLSVYQQEVTGVEGGHVSVQCHYNEPNDRKSWCRAGDTCVEASSGKSGRTEIKDASSEKVFNVTVRELNREDTGWYWCAAGKLQIPVHITVTQKTTTTTVTTPTPSSASTTLCTSLPVSSATTPATANKRSTSKQTSVATHLSSFAGTATYNKSASDLKIVLMALGILLLAVAVAMVTWRLWKRHSGRGSRSSEEDVTYSTVVHKTQSHRESPPQSQPPAEGVVIYSTVVRQKQ
ncbi:hypothetical protein SKAU_G00342960 [Synaphobranchus kaupii]|uniref:Ig-like domain-containing protein n=1 Tax=Synaphobranchus kaupii TaxID=118154 RepID=A0A9Q1EJ27_SYNKA|nr:hypothetical protein SKAU_G00342960 [Synaphobranchus kaupii]